MSLFDHKLIVHAREDCSDPDCEIHCPWMIEDPDEQAAAIAWFIAGARAFTYQYRDAREEFIRNIEDELRAPDLAAHAERNLGMECTE